MQVDKLSRMVRGWFVGDFEPSILRTRDVEVAVKTMRQGEGEARHFHKIATEITVVISGRARMNDVILVEGGIPFLQPGERCDFEALTDLTLVVVTHPGAPADKFDHR